MNSFSKHLFQKRTLLILLLLLGLSKLFRRLRSYHLSSKLDPEIFPRTKVILMLVELQTQYTPFFTHYHGQIVSLRDQYG